MLNLESKKMCKSRSIASRDFSGIDLSENKNEDWRQAENFQAKNFQASSREFSKNWTNLSAKATPRPSN
jgi:hypothetical protein